MKGSSVRVWQAATVILGLLFVASVGLWVATHVGGERGAAGGQLWQCPMHPEIIQDKPGECPICGMDLVQVEQARMGGAGEGTEGEADMGSGVAGLAPITITPTQEQHIGVRTGTVERKSLSRTIRTVGLVKPDETRLSEVNAKVDGWIEKLHVEFTGELVKQGQPLLAIYSPDLVATQEEYLLALRSRERLKDSAFPEVARSGNELVASAERRLRLWDISDAQIRRLRTTGKPQKTLTLHAPFNGFVMHRTATEGMHVSAGMELFKLADLSRVWVEADFFEAELPLVKAGQEATIRVKGVPDKTYTGKVDYVYPVVDGQTRTVKARFVVPNGGFLLKPGMYADVELEIPLGQQLALPTEAVIDTGERQVVFVVAGEGRYVPREIEIGQRVEDWYVVESGLEGGEKVVTSGQFMIDSESRLKAAIAARTGGADEPADEGAEHAGHAGQ